MSRPCIYLQCMSLILRESYRAMIHHNGNSKCFHSISFEIEVNKQDTQTVGKIDSTEFCYSYCTSNVLHYMTCEKYFFKKTHILCKPFCVKDDWKVFWSRRLSGFAYEVVQKLSRQNGMGHKYVFYGTIVISAHCKYFDWQNYYMLSNSKNIPFQTTIA